MSGLAGGGGGGGSMSATLNSLLEKTSNWDKDERYMATNDLCNELQKDIKVERSLVLRACIVRVFICLCVSLARFAFLLFVLCCFVCAIWFA